MTETFTNNFVIRELKRNVGKLKKRRKELLTRRGEVDDGIAMLERQIKEHGDEIEKLGGVP